MKRTRFLALLMTLCLLAGLAVAEGCAICGGSGKYECEGTIQYCDPDCSSCDGEGSFTRTKQVWVND